MISEDNEKQVDEPVLKKLDISTLHRRSGYGYDWQVDPPTLFIPIVPFMEEVHFSALATENGSCGVMYGHREYVDEDDNKQFYKKLAKGIEEVR